MKLEMHLHTLGNSRCAKVSAEDAAELYRRLGYDGVVVTNHWNEYIANDFFSGFGDKTAKYLEGYEAMRATGIRSFFGVELALGKDYYSQHNNAGAEILVYGITPEEFRKEGERLFSVDIRALRRLADERGWVLVQAHPFRERTKRLPHEFLDGAEVFNGNFRHLNKNFIASAYAKRRFLLPTAGSDFHQPEDAKAGVEFFGEIKDEKALAEALRQKRYRIFKNIKKL